MLKFVTMVILAAATPLLFAEDGPVLSQFRSKLPEPGAVLATVEDPGQFSLGLPEGTTSEIVAVAPGDGIPGAKALRVHVGKAYQPSYQVQIFSSKTTAAVKKGDVLALACWLRSPDTAAGIAYLRLQQPVSPWGSPLDATVTCEREWKAVYTWNVADHDYPAGNLSLAIQLGHQKQVIDIAGAAIVNLGSGVDRSRLPRTRITWPGMEPDAPWRAEAKRRIETYRMGELAIRVVDAAGKPVPNAQVTVTQRKRAFTIGSFVQFANPTRLLTASPDGDKTRDVFTRLFNRGTCPIYWADWGWPQRKDEFLAIGRWLREHGCSVRGHVMVYPGFQYMPSDVVKLKSDPAKLRERIRKQVIEVSEATKPLGFREYDVTNELRDCVDLHKLFGREVVVEWYAEARKTLPNAKLALNENTILTNGGATGANQDLYLDWYRFLKTHGQAPDVLGFQAHFGESFTGAETVWAILDRFARETDAELQITEFDINTVDEEAQGAYTRDFLTACFAHPRMTGFTMWGFWEGDHWLPKGAFWRKDWTPKPNAKVLEELLTKEWWTNANVTTDAQGRVTVKAFLGEHAVKATVAGTTLTANAVLEQPGQKAPVEVKP
ncbi:MAG TPA: endo-1,4-beta-xylanase [Planctomycetota bacterium]|jgi:endo-1,4-beta-xylanase